MAFTNITLGISEHQFNQLFWIDGRLFANEIHGVSKIFFNFYCITNMIQINVGILFFENKSKQGDPGKRCIYVENVTHLVVINTLFHQADDTKSLKIRKTIILVNIFFKNKTSINEYFPFLKFLQAVYWLLIKAP